MFSGANLWETINLWCLNTLKPSGLSWLKHYHQISGQDPHHASQSAPVDLEESFRCEGSFTLYIINKVQQRLLSGCVLLCKKIICIKGKGHSKGPKGSEKTLKMPPKKGILYW